MNKLTPHSFRHITNELYICVSRLDFELLDCFTKQEEGAVASEQTSRLVRPLCSISSLWEAGLYKPHWMLVAREP